MRKFYFFSFLFSNDRFAECRPDPGQLRQWAVAVRACLASCKARLHVEKPGNVQQHQPVLESPYLGLRPVPQGQAGRKIVSCKNLLLRTGPLVTHPMKKACVNL